MISESPDGIVLVVHVQPKAAKTEYVGLYDGALKFRVAAPPREGAANNVLCAFLAERFGLAKSAVVIQAGQGSRRKRVLMKGVSRRQVAMVFGCPT